VHAGGVGTLLGPEGSAAEAGGPAPRRDDRSWGLGFLVWLSRTVRHLWVAGGRGGCGSCQVDSGREHLAASPVTPWGVLSDGTHARRVAAFRWKLRGSAGGVGVVFFLCGFC
jgi:hypothetical protein